MNEELIRATMAKIREVDVAEWNQSDFLAWKDDECGTRSCFAGWALRLSGYGIVDDMGEGGLNFRSPEGRAVNPNLEARTLLGITHLQADAIFYFMSSTDRTCDSPDCTLCVPGCGCGHGVEGLARHVGHVTGLEGL